MKSSSSSRNRQPRLEENNVETFGKSKPDVTRGRNEENQQNFSTLLSLFSLIDIEYTCSVNKRQTFGDQRKVGSTKGLYRCVTLIHTRSEKRVKLRFITKEQLE